MNQLAPTVAVFNTSQDVIDMVRQTFERAGMVVVTAFTHELRDGHVDVERFVRQHDPKVIVYDIAPPYEPNWELFEHIRDMASMAGRHFVLTSVNTKQVEKLSGRLKQPVYEIVGKPVDLNQLVTAVKEATRARPTR
jgi:DNA-binding NtrC family response regulator